jgi:ParB family transcriptional regulator, chromosome partitioning protein
MSATITINDVEIAHLELAYGHTRIRRPRQILGLAESLLRCGQLLPIVVVPAEPGGFVLIDGYQRVEAARRAGIDTLQAQVWPQSAPEALCRLLASDGARQFDVFEQAAVLRELKSTHGLSQSRIAAQMGRHPSWITRRLALIEEMPQSAIEAVRAGLLSSWSASRVVAPLARANIAHARALIDALAKEPLTSRQLHGFWQHYRKANRALREKMSADPLLFFKSLAARQADDQDRIVADGPEGQWLRDLGIAANILARLHKTARQVFCARQSTLCRRRLTTAFTDAKERFERLQRTIGRLCDAKTDRPTDRDRHAPGRTEHPADQPPDEDVAKNHPAHPCRPCARGPQPAQPL